MGCIDIKYKNYHIKITNGEVESEVFNTSDTDLLYQFITTGTLPEGYTIESDIDIKSPNDVKAIFREIINDINVERTASDKYLEVQQFVLTPEFINKAAGNRDWATAMYDPYAYTHRIGLQNNCLYISGLGNKTTYGFTKDRPFKITGWSVQTPNIVDDTLLNSYINLLDNDLMVTNTINKLYLKLNPDGTSTDIFEKLTWLSNNQLKELISSLYIPRAITYDLNNTSIEELLKNANNVKGLGTKVNKKMYILTGKTVDGELEAFEISKTNDEKINIPKESIKHLYQTFEIYDTTGNYIILNKIWYKIEKGKYIRVDDKKLSDDLFNKWFGLIDDSEFETIDTGNKELNITLNHKTDNGPLSDVLPIGSYVRSAIGYYTKDIDGLFKNGDRILSENEKIYKIFYKKSSDIKSTGVEQFGSSDELLQQVNLVFERIPELRNIGTTLEYAVYLQTIFPDSEDQNIYWHGSDSDFSEGLNSATRGEGSGSLETKKRNDFYLAKQAWTVLQYVSGVNRSFGPDVNGFNHWNKLWWELKEIMSNGRRHNNAWKDLVIGPENVRQGIPNKHGVFNRDSGGTNGKWLKERKADYGYQDKSDEEFFRDVFGIEYGKDTFNTWTQRNAKIFKSLEKTEKGITPVIINTKNPIVESGQNTYYEQERGLMTLADKNGNDAILGSNTDNEFNSDIAVVLNANNENLYFLGTKQDIAAFKNWLQLVKSEDHEILLNSLKTSIPYKNDSYTLSRNDALIILSEYGIENFADVWLDYDSNNNGEIIYSNKKNKILLHIGLNGNIEQTLDNIRAFKLATEFFKALNNNEVPPELASLSNVGFIFKYIKEGNFITDIVNLGKKGTITLSTESINWIKNFVNSIDISETEWTDILDSNKDALSIWNDEIDSELDAKIEKYEKEGRITRMCTWK